jgi:hypothetical protein
MQHLCLYNIGSGKRGVGLKFDKEKFALLLIKARGERSINQYALHSGVTSAHISRLSRALLDSPPTPQTIGKLAKSAYNGVTYEDFMDAAGYIPDAYSDATFKYDEVQKEILIAKESGVEINHETAQEMVENRKRFSDNKKSVDYMFHAKTLADALVRLAELDIEYNFDDETMLALVRKVKDKYGLPRAQGAERAAHGPKFPGSGAMDKGKRGTKK